MSLEWGRLITTVVGAATDKQGYALHGSIDAAEAALIDAANIDYTEVRLIFNSVDAVQPYS